MLFSKNDNAKTGKVILIAPLDWGLGHAARCIPIIKELQNYPVKVIIAADGAVKAMLIEEFPQLQFVTLKGYNIKYSKNKRWFLPKLLIQFPKILSSIVKEHRWLNKVIQELGISAVISDNRLGLYSNSVFSVYITHQLNIKAGNGISAKIATLIHQFYIKNYTQCWIPDYNEKKNMAGALSHPAISSSKNNYIGCLSRLEKKKPSENTAQILIILSGPEPQRSLFEIMLIKQLEDFMGRVLFVRGLPGTKEKPQNFQNVVFKNHLTADELGNAMQGASLIISRSGYTTIMDLIKLGCKAVLVPTPGQTEQEYLAGYLSEKKIFCTMSQENFSLQRAIEISKGFSYEMPLFNMELYKNAVKQLIEKI